MARRGTSHHAPDPDDDDADADDEYGGEAHAEADTAYCPECGAEIYDAADICPKCFAWIDGDTSRHAPRRKRAAVRWTTLVVWILIIAMALGAGLLGVFSFWHQP